MSVVRGIESAAPPLAKHHSLIACVEHVLGREEPLVDRRCGSTVDDNRPVRCPNRTEEHEILHVVWTDLDDVDVFGDDIDVVGFEHLRAHRKARLSPGVFEHPQRFTSEASVGIRGRPGEERPGAEYRPAVLGNEPGGGQDLLLTLDRHRPSNDGIGAVAELDGPDRDDSRLDAGSSMALEDWLFRHGSSCSEGSGNHKTRSLGSGSSWGCVGVWCRYRRIT